MNVEDLDNRKRTIERLGATYMLLQGIGVLIWWTVLLTKPQLQQLFLPNGAPKSTLLAFLLPDVALMGALSILCSFGLWRQAKWVWPLLCIQAGAAIYGGLYATAVPIVSGGGGQLGALLMIGPLFVPGWLAWSLRPTRIG